MHLQADIRRAFLKMEEVEHGHEWDSIEAEIREEFDRLEKANNELGNKYDQQVTAVRSQIDTVIRSRMFVKDELFLMISIACLSQ